MSMTPAEVVIKELGIRKLARDLGLKSPSAVSHWRNRGGGLVPSRYHPRIIELADGRISAEDLIYGRDARS